MIITFHKCYNVCEYFIEGLRAYFEKFGKVKDAVIMTDPDSFPPRDFGLVTFEDPSIVESVCSQEHILNVKKVNSENEVMFAI